MHIASASSVTHTSDKPGRHRKGAPPSASALTQGAEASGEISVEELLREVERIATGGSSVARDALMAIFGELLEAQHDQRQTAAAEAPRLSDREREVLALLVEGFSVAGIARRLFLSPNTVRTHKARLFRKLGVRSSVEVVRWALERTGNVADEADAAALVATLSERERQVLLGLARGYRREDVADQLGMSRATLQTHLMHAFRKLQVRSAHAAIAVVLHSGLAPASQLPAASAE